MDTISPSSSSSSTHQWKYHVFLSFRGEDTRNNFTDHLYAALKQKGIYTFRDDKKLERGKRISEIFKAIEDSLFTIVILSRNYASSTWCLDELVKIMECEKKMGQIVLPIFYNVEPSVVRTQTGTYEEAFVEHEKRFNKNLKKVDEWRAALTDVTNLSGWPLGDRPESEFIQDITKFISLKLSSLFPKDTNSLVGINSRVEKLMSLLAIGSSDVRIIGIWGMGGIGKTTLARFVFDMVFKKFEGGCFIVDVRGESEKCGLHSLQQKLIREILMDDSVNIRDDCDGVLTIKNRLCHKKVLLVLDNVNQFNQLEKLVGDSKWFGLGSRVIITTRNENLLTKHKVHEIYEAQGFNDYEALHLFSLKAFNKYHPPEDYLDLSTSFVDYAKGLPLAIDVLGAFLYNRGKKEWEGALARLKEYPKKEIIEVLEISFDGLGETETEIFLHIACFFNKEEKDYMVEILNCLGLYPEIGLKVLIERSLLKEYENNYWMHDMLRIMGQDRVRRGFPREPGKWSRLWRYRDIRNVLMKNMEMGAIQGLVLKLGELHKLEKEHWNLEAFSKMPNLQLLMIHDVQLQDGPKHLPNNLRFLGWSGYPSKSLPSNFEPHELVGLHLLDSKIERLWKDAKYLGNLKSIKLNNSLDLIATPDFTRAPNLEKLVCDGCIKLREVHPSIMVHRRLTLLDLGNCKSLRCLPGKFEMESLEVLILSGCSKFERIPEFMKNMKRLSKLHLNGTAITELPSSIQHLTNLEELWMEGCEGPLHELRNILFPLNLMQRSLNPCLLLTSFFGLRSLKRMDLRRCNLQIIPNDIENLSSITALYLSENHFSCLPESMGQLSKLRCIGLDNCTKLRSLSPLPSTVCVVQANGCTSLETFLNGFKLDDFCRTDLSLINCFKLVGQRDMFSNLLGMLLTAHEEICKKSIKFHYSGAVNIVIPGFEIPKWFTRQSVGNTVSAQVTYQNENKWIGIAVCVVPMSHPNWEDILLCCIQSNERFVSKFEAGFCPGSVNIKSDHLWMSFKMFSENERAVLGQIDENGFIQLELECRWMFDNYEFYQVGFRVVYEQDMEDIREMISAQSSNSTCITPYEGLDVHHNSTEGIKLKLSCDEYEGAGASGEGNSKSLTMSLTQRGLKDRELMCGLMLILIARILMMRK